MNFKAVFFDFDYTLADGTEAIVAGFRYVAVYARRKPAFIPL